MLIATCGPTGVGKTYQMRRWLSREPERNTTVLSVTTRPSRGEEDAFWYRFMSRDELARLDPSDIFSRTSFRGEEYLILRSEVDAAMARAPVAFMAIRPDIILLMREQGMRHSLINCRVADETTYCARLVTRGYTGEALEREVTQGIAFAYPPPHEDWPTIDAALCSPSGDDDARFDAALAVLRG